MKRMYLKASGNYWEWEKTGKIYVFSLSEGNYNDIEEVINLITKVIDEFKLPLIVKNGNKYEKEDLSLIKELLQRCVYEGKYIIDFNSLENELEELRREEEKIPYGVIVLVDDVQYEFKNPPSTREPTIYGSGTPEGLIIIHKKHLYKAMVHEFGHMIGLGMHHENCVMSYTCTHEEFCEECRKKIKQNWRM